MVISLCFFFIRTEIPKKQALKSRKRTRNPQNNEEAKRKRAVQLGEEHVSKSGLKIERKVFRAQDSCKCNRNCAMKIGVKRQRDIFDEFYQFKSWSQKTLFLWSLVQSHDVKKKIIPITQLKKIQTKNSYYLTDVNGMTHQVCLSFLINCLQISRATMNRSIRLKISNPTATERRGGYRNRNRFTIVNDILFLKAYINKFPRYKSHYQPSKSNSTASYLPPTWNIIRMYREYSLICRASKRRVLSEWMFRTIFNTEFNLRFKHLKVDTCKTCDRIECRLKCANAREHLILEKEKEDHNAVEGKYRDIFIKSIDDAIGDEHTELLTFDLQRALEMPRLSTSIAYYKRKLWLYNLCIYDEKRRIGYMYAWPETIASRGAQEIGACLCRHFREKLPPSTRKLILYSDSCYGQNRNQKLALILKKFLDEWTHSNLVIEQRYFIVGHSYNSCDRCFGLISTQSKITENIFIPQHWIQTIRQAKKSDPLFVVNEMKKEDFLSSVPLEKMIVNRKKSTSGNRISWNNFQTIIYDKKSPFILKFREFSRNEAPVIEVSWKKRGITRNFAEADLPLLYPHGRAIDKKKYDDLIQSLNYVPENYHDFFKTLKYDTNDKKHK